MNKPIQILLADDHPIVRAGIRALLACEQDFVVVGEVCDSHEVQRSSQLLQPDILLLDLRMPGPPSIETVAYLRTHCPKMAILILSAYAEDVHIHGLMTAGADGYVLKDEAPEALLQAIHIVLQGGKWFSQRVTEKLFREKGDEPLYSYEPVLTSRERDLLNMIAQGESNARIAACLHLAEQTVRNYASHLYVKLNVQSRGEAIVWAREHGLGAA